LFLERQSALRILHKNLQSKSQIELQKRISSVDHTESGVTVTCEDGTSISGDVLIGCDGVHSVVRREMWRLAHLHEQNTFDPADKDLLFAEYQCLFGISAASESITDGEINMNFDEGLSTMIVGGKQRVFWFIFKKMDKIWQV
jgi:flavin-dependent dehydrogenase